MQSQFSKSGRPEIGIRHFGQTSVNGSSRVPKPAASNNALIELTP